MWNYTEKVKELYLNPQNAGIIKDADAIGQSGSIMCGDALKLYLKIKDGIITDAKFQTFGCGSAIASSSALTLMIIGKPIEEAEKITNRDIVDYLGGLPEEKIHCSVMGAEVLENAISSWKGKPVIKKTICSCHDVPKDRIVTAISQNNLKSIAEVSNYTKAGSSCGSCHNEIREILTGIFKKRLSDKITSDKVNKDELALFQTVESILENISFQDCGIKPEIADISQNTIYINIENICENYRQNVKSVIELKLKEYIDKGLEIILI